MLKRLLAGLFSGILAAVLPACDAFNLPKLKPGQTTMAETREIMGPPTMEWQNTDGSATWEYPRTPNGIVNYMIDFGPDRILKTVRQVLTQENFARVSPGMDQDDIRRLLGKPAREVYFPLMKETVWDWKTKSDSSYDEYFNVHFNPQGTVIRTSRNMESRG